MAQTEQMMPSWRRGPVTLEDGQWLVVPKAKWYDIEPGPSLSEIPFALAGVRTPADAVAFAERYGLLRGAARERYQDWQREAGELSIILGLYVDLSAALADDAASEAVLRDFFVQLGEPTMQYLEMTVRAEIAGRLNLGRENVRTEVLARQDGDRWRLRFVTHAKTLLAIIYQELSELLVAERPMRYCQDCGRVFLVRDKRQRFCNDTCAARARYAARKQRESTSAVDAGRSLV